MPLSPDLALILAQTSTGGGFLDGILGWLLFPVVIVLCIVGYLREKKRREALTKAAQARGWTVTARDDSYKNRWDGGPFQKGHSQKCYLVIHGVHNGRHFVTFDYQYKTTSRDSDGKSKTTTHNRAVFAMSNGAYFPNLSVAPINRLEAAMDWMSSADIDLESDAFNKAFRVMCSDRKFAYDVLHARAMEGLLATGQGVSWQMFGTETLAISSGKNSIERIDERARVLAQVLDGIPPFVWQQHGAAPAA